MALPLMEKNGEDVNAEAGMKNEEKRQGDWYREGRLLVEKMKY